MNLNVVEYLRKNKAERSALTLAHRRPGLIFLPSRGYAWVNAVRRRVSLYGLFFRLEVLNY